MESGHGTFGGASLNAEGIATPSIRGPRLDGGEFASISDTDNGLVDGDKEFDRAVGPMQFIPQTFVAYRPEKDSNPQNIKDASKAAGNLLCAVSDKEKRPITDADVERSAILSYNQSQEYVDTVRKFRDDFKTISPQTTAGTGEITPSAVAEKLGQEGRGRWKELGRIINDAPGEWLDTGYNIVDPVANLVWVTLGSSGADLASKAATPVESRATGDQVNVQGIVVDSSIAIQLGQMLDAARKDGFALGGSGWRSTATQEELRVRNGCPDVHESPAESCTVPTAIPGRSLHERGLAIDFNENGEALSGEAAAWLAANVGRYGLCIGVPGENWHASTTCG